MQAGHTAALAGAQLFLRLCRHRCADEEVCARHAPVPAGIDVETHGRGAEAGRHGQLGHTGSGPGAGRIGH